MVTTVNVCKGLSCCVSVPVTLESLLSHMTKSFQSQSPPRGSWVQWWKMAARWVSPLLEGKQIIWEKLWIYSRNKTTTLCRLSDNFHQWECHAGCPLRKRNTVLVSKEVNMQLTINPSTFTRIIQVLGQTVTRVVFSHCRLDSLCGLKLIQGLLMGL